MSIVSTISERCKRCYSCIRECPAKAIKVVNGEATVIEERCITCGNCVKVCSQQAKLIQDAVISVNDMLDKGKEVFACLAPSFPAAFYNIDPLKIITATKKLGFKEVWDVAYGADIVSNAYRELFKKNQSIGENTITTACPAIVYFVEKHFPQLHKYLAPIVSPMIAVGLAIRKKYGDSVYIVFIGPCIAKKKEILDPEVEGVIDDVLTFKELEVMFREHKIDIDSLEPTKFDSPISHLGKAFPIPGGVLKASGINSDILNNDVVVGDGKANIIEALAELANGSRSAGFYDLLFCQGCIDGPRMLNELSVFARKEIVARFVNEQRKNYDPKNNEADEKFYSDLKLKRSFSKYDLKLKTPTEEEIKNVLFSIKKILPEDQLNCGACGYSTCKEKAIAVCQGLAEPQMCLPYLIDEMEISCQQLLSSNEQLRVAQQRLVQTEKLASIGQLSAGLAHELNNPLGTILLFSHMMLKQLSDNDLQRDDLIMIANEANRCKDIVKGLLDFARQSRVERVQTDIEELVNEVLAITRPKAELVNVTIFSNVEKNIPVMFIDKVQIKQALINIVMNAIEAIENGGSVTIVVSVSNAKDGISIKISDTGMGIKPENLSKLFTPFFTTKPSGKGTGLGLPITYGIIKMHYGQIHVDSTLGEGTTFYITIPFFKESDNKITS